MYVKISTHPPLVRMLAGVKPEKMEAKIILPQPKSRKAELLFDLISGKMIAEQDYDYNRFRGDISDLINKYQVPIRHAEEDFTNKYKHKNKFRKHFILSIHKKKAIKIYNRINKVA